MRVCCCAIPAMGGSCEGCSNNVKPPVWSPGFAAPIQYPFPQIGTPPKDKTKELEQKIEDLLELLRKKS